MNQFFTVRMLNEKVIVKNIKMIMICIDLEENDVECTGIVWD